MKRKFSRLKAFTASALAFVLACPTISFSSLANPQDYPTVLENDSDLIDGKPKGTEVRTHYYGGSLSDGRPAPEAKATNATINSRENVAQSYGNGKTSAYKFGYIKSGSSGNTVAWKFDINGISDAFDPSKEPENEEQEAFYLGDAGAENSADDHIKPGLMSVSYPGAAPAGFMTTVYLGKNAQDSGSIILGDGISTKRSEFTGDKFKPAIDGEWRNGEVVKVFKDNIDKKLELRLSIKPSLDGKYILAEYKVHNLYDGNDVDKEDGEIVDSDRKDTDRGRTVWFGSGSDIMIANHDQAPVWATKKGEHTDKIEGIHGQSSDGGDYILSSFDLITYHPQLPLGIRKRDDKDNSKITTYLSQYSSFRSHMYDDLDDFSYMDGGSHDPIDSEIAFSTRFDLLPGETKTATFAWSMKGPTYYVNPTEGNDDIGTGHMSKPYKTLKKALESIAQKYPRRVYIHVVGDIELDETLTIPSGKDVTIQTTDYINDQTTNSKVSAYPIKVDGDNVRNNSKIIQRKAGFTDPLFKIASDADPKTALRFTDIQLDGNGANVEATAPLVEASAGTVDLQTGSILKNNKIKENPDTTLIPSAIDIKGSANFYMSTGGVVKDNKSVLGSAVKKESSGKFVIGENKVPMIFTIDKNTNKYNKPANVELSVYNNGTGSAYNNNNIEGKENQITVVGTMSSKSRIGVGTTKAPSFKPNGGGCNEIPIITYEGKMVPYVMNNFPVDKNPGQWLVSGDRYLNLMGQGFTYTVSYIDSKIGTSLTQNEIETLPSGSIIAANPKDFTDKQYVCTGVKIEPERDDVKADSSFNINAVMPSSNIFITYEYSKNVLDAKFIANGGRTTIKDISYLVGGSSDAKFPIPTKIGYTFKGWYQLKDIKKTDSNEIDEEKMQEKVNEYENNSNDKWESADFEDPDGAPLTEPRPGFVLGEKYYVAKWELNADTYSFKQVHRNNNNSMPITFKTEVEQKRYKQNFKSNTINIPGYKLFTYNIEPIAISGMTFDDTTKSFAGNMPLRAVNVDYKYRVDSKQRFNFKIEHKLKKNGHLEDMPLGAAYTGSRMAETAIMAEPKRLVGYELDKNACTITYPNGGTENTYKLDASTGNGIAKEKTGSFDDSMKFSGKMPNQDVTITYVYKQLSDYVIIKRFVDIDNDNKTIGDVEATPCDAGNPVNIPFKPKYGYEFESAKEKLKPNETGLGGSFDGQGNYTNGTMKEGNAILVYSLKREKRNHWKEIKYQVSTDPRYNKGQIDGNCVFEFLTNDGTEDGNKFAHKFSDLLNLGLVANVKGNPEPYYKFEGWYKDNACTQKVLANDTFATATTLYAKFVEDPDYWIDVDFDSNEHGMVNNISHESVKGKLENKHLHTWKDIDWKDLVEENLIPSTTPEVNYQFLNWQCDNNPMGNGVKLENGKTYFASFEKDANIWGTSLGHFNPVGFVDNKGKGKIRVDGVYKGNTYIVTDKSGKILDSIKAKEDGHLYFENLYPGTKYDVYEAGGDVNVQKGANIEGTPSISEKKEVLIRALGQNYTLSIDPINEGKTRIVVDPADPDSEYAILDKDGNVVSYPDADNGWKKVKNINDPKIIFDNLDPNEEYTVVARKKGDTAKTPIDKKEEGSRILVDPGDNFELAYYIVETVDGKIKTVLRNSNNSDLSVGGALNIFKEARPGDLVKVSADETKDGRAFSHWEIMNGTNSNIVGKIKDREFEFRMEDSNLVIKAVYERAMASPSNALVIQESRGAGLGEFATTPESIDNLERELTNDKDRELIDVNKAKVEYKIVFKKRKPSGDEKRIAENISASHSRHQNAFTTAFALEIIPERYVDGRKVDRATNSDASLDAVVQLVNKDLDMLDYELIDVTNNSRVDLPGDLVKDNGLFKFTANLNHSYVLTYSKAFKVSFIDDVASKNFKNFEKFFGVVFKVRKGEGVVQDPALGYRNVQGYLSGNEYTMDGIAEMQKPIEEEFVDIYGVKYTFKGFSKNPYPKAKSIFEEDAPINRKTAFYAYYENNKKDVDKARIDLADEITIAQGYEYNPYILLDSLNDLKNKIKKAQDVLAYARVEGYVYDENGGLDNEHLGRMATYEELKQAFDDLKNCLDGLNEEAQRGRTSWINRTGGNSQGGSGSVGKGRGDSKRPLEATPEKYFTLGVNGSWQVDPLTGKYKYIVYGGMPLNNTWGFIQGMDENGNPIQNWYYFDDKSNMATSWIKNKKTNAWYYLSTETGKNNGRMLTAWLKTREGNTLNKEFWYYLDVQSGEMKRGWVLIGDKWYYFAPGNMPDGRPDGSLYTNTVTPDGYQVNEKGEWVK